MLIMIYKDHNKYFCKNVNDTHIWLKSFLSEIKHKQL